MSILRNTLLQAILILFTLCIPVAGLQAESLEVPATKKETFSITLPGRGMTMESVREQFGEPQEEFNQVGNPPIARWVYKGFTVYFESNYVIHAVFHKPE